MLSFRPFELYSYSHSLIRDCHRNKQKHIFIPIKKKSLVVRTELPQSVSTIDFQTFSNIEIICYVRISLRNRN